MLQDFAASLGIANPATDERVGAALTKPDWVGLLADRLAATGTTGLNATVAAQLKVAWPGSVQSTVTPWRAAATRCCPHAGRVVRVLATALVGPGLHDSPVCSVGAGDSPGVCVHRRRSHKQRSVRVHAVAGARLHVPRCGLLRHNGSARWVPLVATVTSRARRYVALLRWSHGNAPH